MLLAEDDLSDAEIAQNVGVSRATISNWKQQQAFNERISDYVAQLNAATMRYRIAKRRHRIKTLDDLHTKSLEVMEHRAARYQAQLGTDDVEAMAAQAAKAVLGGYVPTEAATGLLVEKESINNAGHRTVEWSVDTGLIRQIQSLEEQAAKELGQWAEKSEINQTSTIQIIGVDVEAL